MDALLIEQKSSFPLLAFLHVLLLFLPLARQEALHRLGSWLLWQLDTLTSSVTMCIS